MPSLIIPGGSAVIGNSVLAMIPSAPFSHSCTISATLHALSNHLGHCITSWIFTPAMRTGALLARP